MTDPLADIRAWEQGLIDLIGPLRRQSMATFGPPLSTFVLGTLAMFWGADVLTAGLDADLRSAAQTLLWMTPAMLAIWWVRHREAKRGTGGKIRQFTQLWNQVRALHRRVEADDASPDYVRRTLAALQHDYDTLAQSLSTPPQ